MPELPRKKVDPLVGTIGIVIFVMTGVFCWVAPGEKLPPGNILQLECLVEQQKVMKLAEKIKEDKLKDFTELESYSTNIVTIDGYEYVVFTKGETGIFVVPKIQPLVKEMSPVEGETK